MENETFYYLPNWNFKGLFPPFMVYWLWLMKRTSVSEQKCNTNGVDFFFKKILWVNAWSFERPSTCCIFSTNTTFFLLCKSHRPLNCHKLLPYDSRFSKALPYKKESELNLVYYIQWDWKEYEISIPNCDKVDCLSLNKVNAIAVGLNHAQLKLSDHVRDTAYFCFMLTIFSLLQSRVDNF